MIGRSRVEALALVLLRTIVGWHFLYEGYYKLLAPGWSRAGAPVADWSAAGYLRAATGPFADAFRTLADSAVLPWIDQFLPIALVLIGLSLMLGLFTQLGCWGAFAALTGFYLASIPTTGAPVAGAEGVYLLVNKTLVEWAAVVVLLAARTGRIAGIDHWRARRPVVEVEHAAAGSR